MSYSTAVWDKNLESSMLIVAENGSVKIGGQYMNEVEYCHIKDYEMPELVLPTPAMIMALTKAPPRTTTS